MGPRSSLSDGEVRERLRHHLIEQGLLNADATEMVCSPLTGGFSHETWRITADRLDGVVKVATGDGPLAHYDIVAEASMTERAARAGVPTARVLTSTDDPAIIGAAFMVSEFVDGAVPSVGSVVKWLAAGPADFRPNCARSVVEVLVRLGGAGAAEGGRPALDAHYAEHLDSTVQALADACQDLLTIPPSVAVAHRWLRDRVRRLAGEPAALTHGDFRIGNLIFQGTSVAALLDWERAGWGHRLYDLGYLCLPGMRHGDRIGGLMTESELRSLWREVSGDDLDLEQVAFFRCMSIFTELVNCVRALVNYTQGRGRASLLRILPLIVRLENDVLAAIERIDAGDPAL